MSQKITSKNLQYSQNLPPFLAALRGQASSNADAPDPILAARRRPVKPRSGSAEAEDAPLVLDEAGNVVLGVEISKDGAVKEVEASPSQGPQDKGDDRGETESGALDMKGGADVQKKLAGIGAAKKRKLGKVVGANEEPEEESNAKSKPLRADAKNKPSTLVPKKKPKKVKLSFGDGDGD